MRLWFAISVFRRLPRQRQAHAGLERPGGADAFQTDPQLHQRLRHLRLDAGQDHLRP